MGLEGSEKLEHEIEQVHDNIENRKEEVSTLQDMANDLEKLTDHIEATYIGRGVPHDHAKTGSRKPSSGQLIATMQNEIDRLKKEGDKVSILLMQERKKRKELESAKNNLLNVYDSLKMQKASVSSMVNRKQRAAKEEQKIQEEFERQITDLLEEQQQLKLEIERLEAETERANSETEQYEKQKEALEEEYEELRNECLKHDPQLDAEIRTLQDTFEEVERTLTKQVSDAKIADKPLKDSMFNSNSEKEKIMHALEKAEKDADIYSEFIQQYMEQLESSLEKSSTAIENAQNRLAEMTAHLAESSDYDNDDDTDGIINETDYELDTSQSEFATLTTSSNKSILNES
ncbi:contractile ring myosin V regulator Rng8 [Schizosaccharomyces pombe]|uniref:Uncharacterized protein C4H3.14c n=1 Tax=Schizosaccharomyces pombe (strain 972 / ATCC 24843) TaxID=284812 RepID=YAYE_SCHPO|nr:uncharacterized protein SPAC4H3.14c [Schizosaccharomyces pombe]Q10221.1 RecName: Full=Uncharacterized protein C4H3.14c [Schizosaccharomyces pombe 972h-]CAA93353.1 sequence orphan [Schizosaccharomyces pombe]|eukprot:NP_594350.1 uncharacterized protein SPAC4H3.14c [Schizosaccharomyces pombe]